MAQSEQEPQPAETILWSSERNDRVGRRLGRASLKALVLTVALVIGIEIARQAFGLTRMPAYTDLTFVFVFPVLILLFLWSGGGDTKVTVTTGHVTWRDTALFLRRISGSAPKTVSLDSIDRIDINEGVALDVAELRCGEIVHELVVGPGGKAEAIALATGRPYRIWRRRTTLADKWARWWERIFGTNVKLVVIIGGALAIGKFVDALDTSLPMYFAVLIPVVLIATVLWELARITLPHFLVGRNLTKGARQEFIYTLLHERWDIAQPRVPETWAKLNGRWERWAMRAAYGAVPEIEKREPEIIGAQG